MSQNPREKIRQGNSKNNSQNICQQWQQQKLPELQEESQQMFWMSECIPREEGCWEHRF